jgi:hypothetical protein
MSAVTSTFAVAGAARLGSSAALRGRAIRTNARGASVAPARGATLRVNAEGTRNPRSIESPAARPSARRDVTRSETEMNDRRDPKKVSFMANVFASRVSSARVAFKTNAASPRPGSVD